MNPHDDYEINIWHSQLQYVLIHAQPASHSNSTCNTDDLNANIMVGKYVSWKIFNQKKSWKYINGGHPLKCGLTYYSVTCTVPHNFQEKDQ